VGNYTEQIINHSATILTCQISSAMTSLISFSTTCKKIKFFKNKIVHQEQLELEIHPFIYFLFTFTPKYGANLASTNAYAINIFKLDRT